jgi:hypothetical protein
MLDASINQIRETIKLYPKVYKIGIEMEYENLIILHYSVKRNYKQKMFYSGDELLEWCEHNLKKK